MSTAPHRRDHDRTSAVDDDVILTGGRSHRPSLSPVAVKHRTAGAVAAIAAAVRDRPSDCPDDPITTGRHAGTDNALGSNRALDIEATLKEKAEAHGAPSAPASAAYDGLHRSSGAHAAVTRDPVGDGAACDDR